MRQEIDISHKANRVLNLILLAFLLIFIRVWYLCYVQHDEQVLKALKPQRKTIVEKAERATIRDRFNIPLAINKIQYNATVRYADLRDIPSGKWVKDADGKKVREPVRNNYIKSLAEFLGQELKLDPVQIEDIIHAKASLFPHTPFVVKEDLSEKEYYTLKLKEKDWIGLEAQKSTKRIYPLGKVGCDILGYVGSINQKEYVAIAEEIKKLQDYILKRDQGEPTILPEGFDNPLEVRARLKELQEKSYTINDHIGKTGIECVYEEKLRGLHGKKVTEVDRRGNCIKELASSKKPISGKKVILSISSELQEYAEALLSHNETVRHKRDPKRMIGVARPWILGGAIVAMDPKTGEILSLASYPRIDPNDFIPSQQPKNKKNKQHAIAQWLETESFVADIWDGKKVLERERFSLVNNSFYLEREKLTWERYLDTILPPESSVRRAVDTIGSVGKAFDMISSFKRLMCLSGQDDPRSLIQVLYSDPHHAAIKKGTPQETREEILIQLSKNELEVSKLKIFLDSVLHNVKFNDDKMLVLDLCRLALSSDIEDKNLFSSWKNLSLTHLREIHQSIHLLQGLIQEETLKIFHEKDFNRWRQQYFKDFLKQKRKEEKERKKYVQPYTDYLEKIERTLFKEFWDQYKSLFLDLIIQGKPRWNRQEYPQIDPYVDRLLILKKQLSHEKCLAQLEHAFSKMSVSSALDQIKAATNFAEMKQPLWGKYRSLRTTQGEQQLKHLAGAFYPLSGYGYGRSQAFRQTAAQGSVFKLVVAYEAMRERYFKLKEQHQSLAHINPLTLVDQLKLEKIGTNQQILGYTLDGDPIQRYFKGGRLPRSHPNIGRIDVCGALEQSSNLYFAYLASEYIESTAKLEETTRNFGYGNKTGISLPGEIPGNIPKDIHDNKTGLYSFSIGQHSLVVTPLQTSVMLSAIGNKGQILKPQMVKLTEGACLSMDKSPFLQDSYSFKESLSLVGIDFPLFTEPLGCKQQDNTEFSGKEVLREIFMPDEIRNKLIEGMQNVINGPKGTARPNVIKALWTDPKILKDYVDLRYQLIGKTGTAETLYKQWIDSESLAEISNNIWFGGLSFYPNEDGSTNWDDPELAIVIYLKFSDTGGKEAAPLAAQMVAKWREICQKHGGNSSFEGE